MGILQARPRPTPSPKNATPPAPSSSPKACEWSSPRQVDQLFRSLQDNLPEQRRVVVLAVTARIAHMIRAAASCAQQPAAGVWAQALRRLRPPRAAHSGRGAPPSIPPGPRLEAESMRPAKPVQASAPHLDDRQSNPASDSACANHPHRAPQSLCLPT